MSKSWWPTLTCLPSLHSWFWNSFWIKYISTFLTWHSFHRDVKPDICKTFLTRYISKSFLRFYWILAQLQKTPCRFIWLITDAWMKDCKKLQWCLVLVIQHRSITSIFWNKGQDWQLFNFSLPQRLILMSPSPLPLHSGLLNKINEIISHLGTVYTRHTHLLSKLGCSLIA